MKILVKSVIIVAALAFASAAAYAQNPKLQIDSISRLEDSASKVVDIALDEKLMGMATRFLKKTDIDDEDAKKAIEILAGIKEIYVRSYEFDAEGAYNLADVDPIRAQVKGLGWSRLVGVRNKKTGENAEVYMLSSGDKVLGMAIISAEPKELTIVNIVGSIDIDRISELDGDFGIPRLELKRDKPSGN